MTTFEWAAVAIVVSLFAVLAAALVVSHHRRKRQIEGLAAEGWVVHWRPAPDVAAQVHAPVATVDAIRRRGSDGVQWCAIGQVDGRQVGVLEHRYTTGSGKNRQVHHNTLAWIDCPRDWAVVALRAEGLFSKLAALFGRNDLQVEDPAFNKRWKINSDDEGFALVVLSPAVQRWLSDPTRDAPRNEWWHIGGGVICCGRSSRLDLDGIRDLLDQPHGLLGALLPELRSLVPTHPATSP